MGVPQGSALGSHYFHMYLNDLLMFLKETKVTNYADDTTICAFGPIIETVIAHSEHNALKITERFQNNYMKLNEDKCHSIVFGAKIGNEITIKIGNAFMKGVQKKIFSLSLSINHFLSKNMSRPCVEMLAKNYMLLPVPPATWALKNCSI